MARRRIQHLSCPRGHRAVGQLRAKAAMSPSQTYGGVVMKRYRLASMVCMGVLLLGSLMTLPAPALATDTIHDQAKGSLLVYPIFDVIGANRTKIELTNRAASAVTVRVTYICQSQDPSTVCKTFA